MEDHVLYAVSICKESYLSFYIYGPNNLKASTRNDKIFKHA